MPVYFDVGANDGESMIWLARQNPANIVYAFEPTPILVGMLLEKAASLPNYKVVPKAVSDWEGRSTFGIAAREDWGCSSLHTFNDNLDQTWPGRHFGFTESVEVDVIRLDSFITQHSILEVEFLHVDVQGCDMEVLLGLGDHLRKVKAGVIEMPSSHDVKLYKTQKYVAQDAIEFLQRNGFQIVDKAPNDRWSNELNIKFRRL
jgi:FkbM family methyltransferase